MMLPTTDPLFWLYVVLGPGAWIVFSVLMLLGWSRLNRLLVFRPAADEPMPTSSVIAVIPARNEAAVIGDAVRSVLEQDLPNLRVVVVDDRSTDATGDILDRLAAENPRLSVLHVRENQIPPGWLGKNYAIAQGVAHALTLPQTQADPNPNSQQWMWFVDSDVIVRPDALRLCLQLARRRDYQAVSLLTALTTVQLWEKLFMPLAAAGWGAMFTISLTNNDQVRSVAYANGQFFLIRRDVYHATGGHEMVKSSVVEDCDLMAIIKRLGHRGRFLLGPHVAATRMYSTIDAMLRGWGRIYSGSSNRRAPRIAGGIFFVLFCMLPAWPVLAIAIIAGHGWWIGAASLHLLVMTVCCGAMIHWSRNSVAWALALPVSCLGLLVIFVRALAMCFGGQVNWRGSVVAVKANDAR